MGSPALFCRVSLTYYKSPALSSESSRIPHTHGYEYIFTTTSDLWGHYCSQSRGLPCTALTSTLRVLSLTQKLPATATEVVGCSKPQVHLGSCWAYPVKPCCCRLGVCLLVLFLCLWHWLSITMPWLPVVLGLFCYLLNLGESLTPTSVPYYYPVPKVAWLYASDNIHRYLRAK